MGSKNKSFQIGFAELLGLILILSYGARNVSGATVLSPNIIPHRQIPTGGGCILTLPRDRIYAPSVTDQKTFLELLPTQDKLNGLWFFRIEQDRRIKINCGRGNPLTDQGSYYYLLLSCVRGNEFLNDEDELLLLPEGVECSNARKPTPIVYRNGTCSGKGTNFDVEFVSETPRRKFYSVCMEEGTSGTLYSSSYIDGESFANGLVEGSGNRPNFRGEEFYPFAIKQAYKWENAFEHLSELIGSSELVEEYFPEQHYRFSRGHLFPNADGVKRFEKHATFYYINTVPQWQILNGGNWNLVEQDVRELATTLSRTLKIITGSFGVTTLKDVNNNDVEIYLARDSTGKLRLPVPRLVWKVVHDPAGNAAVAIVQINNPWAQSPNLRNRDVLCNDLCDSLPWLRSSGFHGFRKGYTYCCDVNELRRGIPYIPHLQYDKLVGVDYSNNSNNDDDADEDDSDESDSNYDDNDDGSSDDISSDYSSSSEIHLKNPKIDVHNITALFNSIRLG